MNHKLKEKKLEERMKAIEEKLARIEQSKANRNKEERISTEKYKSRSPSIDTRSQDKAQALTSRNVKSNMNITADNWKSDSLKALTNIESKKPKESKASSTLRAEKVQKERQKKFNVKDKLWNIKMHHTDEVIKQREKERLLKIHYNSEAYDLK